LPVRYAWDASVPGTGKSACATRATFQTGRTNSWRLLLAGWDLLCAVDDGEHIDLVSFDVVDDSKGTFDYLSDLGDPEFRDFAPRQGELSNLLGASGQPVNNAQGVWR